MSIHQQVNPNTVDPSQLPDHLTAGKVMDKVSRVLWDVHNSESYVAFHDYWSSSTYGKKVRSLRIRHDYDDAVNAVLPHVHELLAQYEGRYKVYFWNRHKYIPFSDKCGDGKWVKQPVVSIMLYYRSWQTGDLREYQTPDEGYALTFHKGDRIEYRTHTGKLVKATILKRGSSLNRRPSYRIRCDEPRDQPIRGKIEDLPEWQQDWYYETYAHEPDVRALEG